MQTAPLPANEEQRLARLRGLGILDTLPQKAFDDISSLAQLICGTPVALITLVDRDRQWFKSRIGMDASETPREVAFCSHAILDAEHVMVVEDSHRDARFQDNPLVIGSTQVRFYAGAPIVTNDGYALGTVCVIDQQARQLHSVQLDALSKLSGLVANLLEHEKTRQAEADRARATERQQHEQLTAMALLGVDLQSFVDASGVYRHVNDTYLAYHGCAREDVVGRHVTEQLGDDVFRDRVESRLQRALAGETITYQREAHFRAKGSRHMEVTLLPVHDAQGRVIGVVTRGHDIQALKDREAELHRTVALLEQKTLEQERFIHIISHDLREPINSINNFSALLSTDHAQDLPPLAQRYLGFVQAGGLRMDALLDDLAEYVRLDRRATASGPVDVARLLDQVRDDLASALLVANGRLESDALPMVQADASLLRIALQNLVSNGLKFARPDTPPLVRVSATREDGFDLIHVDDNGIGIAPEHQPAIFDMFKRLHSRQRYDGSGLGLSICRRIVEQHGGQISVRSVPGAGSRFTLHLPASPATSS